MRKRAIPSSTGRRDLSQLTDEYIVKEIISVLDDTFGKGVTSAMESCFDSLYKISFADNSIVEYPDRFAEALQYAFGVGSEPMLNLINAKLGQLVSSEGMKDEDLVKSGTYGFVFLINKIRRMGS
jgi:hypothetical protein